MLDNKIDPAIRQLVAIVSRSDGKTTDMEHFEDVHMLLALCYRYKGMYDKALEQFEQVKKQHTQYPLIDMYRFFLCETWENRTGIGGIWYTACNTGNRAGLQ